MAEMKTPDEQMNILIAELIDLDAAHARNTRRLIERELSDRVYLRLARKWNRDRGELAKRIHQQRREIDALQEAPAP